MIFRLLNTIKLKWFNEVEASKYLNYATNMDFTAFMNILNKFKTTVYIQPDNLMLQEAISFVASNLPESFFCKSPEDFYNPKIPINEYINTILTQYIPFLSSSDKNVCIKYVSSLTTYNKMLLENVVNTSNYVKVQQYFSENQAKIISLINQL